MNFTKTDPDQGNLIDGTVILTAPAPQEGVYVTVAGRDGSPTIVAFDMTDLAVIHRAAEAVYAAPVGTDPDGLARVTKAGMVLLPEVLCLDRQDGAR